MCNPQTGGPSDVRSVWRSTFLAIRVGVREVPPFLLAAIRFLVAGILLFGWMMVQGERTLGKGEWKSIFVLALLIFVGTMDCCSGRNSVFLPASPRS